VALNNLGLGLLFTATDKASDTINRMNRSLGVLSMSTDRVNKSLQQGIGGALAIRLGSSLGKVTDLAGEFEYNLTKVKNITAATNDEMKLLKQSAITAGLSTQFNPTQAVGGLEALASAGFNANESTKMLIPTLALATGGSIDVEHAAKTVTAALKVFKLGVNDTAVAVDKLFKASDISVLQIEDLALALGTVGRGAGAANQSIDEMLAAIGLVRGTGVHVSVAASSVSSALVEISKKASDFKELGVEVTNTDGSFRKFMDIVLDTANIIEKKYTNQADKAAMTTKLFGRFGSTAYQAISRQLESMIGTRPGINSVTDAVEYLRGQIENSEGTAEKFVNNLRNTYQGQIMRLQGALQTLAILVGEPLTQILKPVVQSIADSVTKLATAFSELQPDVKEAAAMIALLSSGVLLLSGSLAIVRASAYLIIPVIGSLASSLAFAAIAAGPLVAILGTLGYSLMGLNDFFGERGKGFGDILSSGLKSASLAFKGVVQLIREGGFSGAVRDELNKTENQGVKQFAMNIYAIFYRIKRFFEGVRQGVEENIGWFSPTFKKLSGAFDGLAKALGLAGATGQDFSNKMPSETFFAAGSKTGYVMAGVIGFLSDILASGIIIITDFGNSIKTVLTDNAPILAGLGDAISDVAVALGLTFSTMAGKGGQATSIGTTLGVALGNIVIVGAKIAIVVVKAIEKLILVFEKLWIVAGPILRFVANNIELIAAIMVTKFAFSMIGSGVKSIHTFLGSALKLGKWMQHISSYIFVAIDATQNFGRTMAQVGSSLSGSVNGPLRNISTGLRDMNEAAYAGFHPLQRLNNETATLNKNMRDTVNLRAGSVSTISKMSMGFMDMAGAIGLAATAGIGLGVALDQAFNISERLSNFLANKSGSDHTGKASKFDPEGSANSNTLFAQQIDNDIKKSKAALKRLQSELKVDSGNSWLMSMMGMGPTALETRTRDKFGSEASALIENILGGKDVDQTKIRALEQILQQSNLLTNDESLILPKDISAQQSKKREHLREAAAITMANKVGQSNNLEKTLAELPKILSDPTLAANSSERQEFLKKINEYIKEIGNRPIVIQLNGQTLAVAYEEQKLDAEYRGFQIGDIGPNLK
jgi:TP901 family phage tail tape measure protein